MKYTELKHRLLSLFDTEKLNANPTEWGIYNEAEREIKRIGYATNITPEIIRNAGIAEVDILLTHHDAWDFVYGLRQKSNSMLMETGIIHGFFHSVLDDAPFGTNASLAELIGLRNCYQIIPYPINCYCGIVGELEPALSFDDLSKHLSAVLGESIRQFRNNNRPIRKVGIATGGGNMTTDMKKAVDECCDAYITGEYVLYSQQYAQLEELNLFIGSHTNTEIYGVKSMAELLIQDTGLELVRISEPNY